ncbi:MAG: hypothetical protein Q8L06_02885 [Pseudohongiella sp.]|nr:hypothetical protein [Pseudohongiella sp.]
MKPVPVRLLRWQNQSMPDWDRSSMIKPVAIRNSIPSRVRTIPPLAQWLPFAASIVLTIAVFTQARLEVNEQGWSVSFGTSSTSTLDAQQLDEYLTAYSRAQEANTREWVQSALKTHGETTADSVYQWMTYMEQQRELDVKRMEAGFEQLLDRDFQTVDSVRQLASYVMYQVAP